MTSTTERRLAFLCLFLILLASAERRLWESDFNTATSLLVKNGEAGKVINVLMDADRAAQPTMSRITLAATRALPSLRPIAIAPHVLGRPYTRAPPK